MNSFPVHHHDLQDRPVDPARYTRVLEAACCHRSGSPAMTVNQQEDGVERWSLEDAAAHWFAEWGPAEPGADRLSADAITGLAATVFLRRYGDLPLLRKLFFYLLKKVHLTVSPAAVTNPLESVPAALFCRAAHLAFRPGVAKLDEAYSTTGLRAVASKTLRPCSHECCRVTETILGGCISRQSFDNALSSGILVPVRDMNAGPITLLLPRLACWQKSPPCIAISQGELHTKALYAPYWVNDAINNLARLIPPLLVRPEVQAEIRAGVQLLMPKYLTVLREHKVAERRGTVPARTAASRGEHIANLIWQSSGAEPLSFVCRWSLPAMPPRRR